MGWFVEHVLSILEYVLNMLWRRETLKLRVRVVGSSYRFGKARWYLIRRNVGQPPHKMNTRSRSNNTNQD